MKGVLSSHTVGRWISDDEYATQRGLNRQGLDIRNDRFVEVFQGEIDPRAAAAVSVTYSLEAGANLGVGCRLGQDESWGDEEDEFLFPF